MSAFTQAFDGLTDAFGCFCWALIIMVPLAAWKAVDIIIWIFS